MDIPSTKTEGTSDKVSETASTTPEVTPVSEAPKAAPTASKDSPPVPFKNKVPANWHIEVVEDDLILAHNNVSAERFEGTISDFNIVLRA